MGEASSKSSSYYEHDNRMGPDFDKEPPSDDYPRPNRGPNYSSSYRYDRFNDAPNPDPYYSKNMPPSPGSGYSGYGAGNGPSGFNNYFPPSNSSQSNPAQAFLNSMGPMVSQSSFAPLAAAAAAAVASSFNNPQYQSGQMYKNNPNYYMNNAPYYPSRFNSANAYSKNDNERSVFI